MRMKCFLFLLTAATVATTSLSEAESAVMAKANSGQASPSIAPPKVSKRSREARQDSLPSSGEEHELKRLSHVKEMEGGLREFLRMKRISWKLMVTRCQKV